MLAEGPQSHTVAQQHLGRVGHEHLTSVRERHQPCRAVHLAAEIAPVAFDCLTGVQAHTNLDVLEPGDSHLRLLGRCHGIGSPAEGSRETIATGGKEVSVVALDGPPEDVVMGRYEPRHLVGPLLPQGGRPLDIGEQERHGPRWRAQSHPGSLP